MASFKEQWEAAPLWQRAIIVLILPAVVAVVVWLYWVKPTMETRDKLISEKEQLQQEIARYRTMIRPQILENLRKQLEELKEQERQKQEEFERVVGRIPTREDLDRIFGKINSIAFSKNIVITRVAVSRPQVKNFRIVEKEGRKFVELIGVSAQTQQTGRPQANRTGRQIQTRRAQTAGQTRQAQQSGDQTAGVPITTMELTLSMEGPAESVRSFLEDLYAQGLTSYPKSVSIKPLRERGVVKADVVIDIILKK